MQGIKIYNKWNIYSIILIIQVLYSLKAWFLWWIPGQTATVLIFLISLFYFTYAPFWNFRDNKRVVASVVLIILFLYQADGNMNAYMLRFMESFAIIPLVLLKPKYQMDLLEKFQKVITVILAVSLAFWILHFMGINLPSTPITYGQVDRGQGLEAQYLFENHYVFLVNQSWMLKSYAVVPSFLRFCSIFLEPGYLAILMVFFLFINKFEFQKRRNQLYIATIIATVSLAGFLMVAFAYIALRLQHAKRGIAGIILLLLVSFASYNFFQNYNGGRNFINEGIIERLELDDERGIAGNNRTTLNFNDQFQKIVTSPDVIFGKGNRYVKDLGGVNVGYKVYIMKYGAIGLILFLTYLLIIVKTGNGYRAFIMFVLYVLMFIRGDASIFWEGFILVYVGGIAQTKYESLTHEINSNSITLQRV